MTLYYKSAVNSTVTGEKQESSTVKASVHGAETSPRPKKCTHIHVVMKEDRDARRELIQMYIHIQFKVTSQSWNHWNKYKKGFCYNKRGIYSHPTLYYQNRAL